MATVILVLVALLGAVAADPTCGYESCNAGKPGYINLHIVAHSHDDVGWLKTVDQYYYGSRNDIRDAGVQYILDSVVVALKENPMRRFIYVETAFFWKWWSEQSPEMRADVKDLVSKGQLEIIGGSWSMPDEATTHYQSVIDDWTLGFRKLSDSLGDCARPKVGWQIDPFGHSRESAAIMTKLGFDGLFLGRIDYQDKNLRMINKTAEMVWFTSANDQSPDSQLFTSVLYNLYHQPNGFCFDINCEDEPIVEDESSPEYNAERRVEEFLELMRDYAKHYKTSNILVTFGEDFMFMDAPVYFKNIDLLIKHVNKKQKQGSLFNVIYSTPSCYLKAVHDAQVALPIKKDDFLPYSSDPYSFWSGYFTSRPALKYMERMGNNYLQISKQLSMLAGTGSKGASKIQALKEAMAVVQHHDAITGTERQLVTDDYARQLSIGLQEAEEANKIALKKLLSKHNLNLEVDSCFLRNISQCSVSEQNDDFVVTIYNPLSRSVNHVVELPIPNNVSTYTVQCPMGHLQETQILNIPDSQLNIPGRESKSQAKLIFVAKNLPPMGLRSYYISKTSDDASTSSTTKIGNERVTLGYSTGAKITLNQGVIESVTISSKQIPLKQEFLFYNAFEGDNTVANKRSSGAYIFRTSNSSGELLGSPKHVEAVSGPIVTEIRQVYNDWLSQTVRVYADDDSVEFDWVVGPIPIDNGGKEIISRITRTDITNQNIFFTDSNGRELMKRQLNYRDTWDVKLAEKVPGNYYPVVTQISIESGEDRMTVLTDRAQGGSSLNPGQIELMVHRRLRNDDDFGVGEPLNEVAYGTGLVVAGWHYVTFGNRSQVRLQTQEGILDSWVFLTPTNELSFEEWNHSFKMEFSGLKAELPDNVQILTLEPWVPGKSYLLRLEHIMEAEDDPILSLPATVDLKNIFAGLKVTSITETMLGANQKVGEVERLIWNTGSVSAVQEDVVENLPIVTLKPMQIRTFIITH